MIDALSPDKRHALDRGLALKRGAGVALGIRPLTALTAVGAAAHHLFERAAGIGLPLEPWLGRGGSEIVWSLALPTWALVALTRPRTTPLLAAANGAAVATVAIHYAEWQWHRRGLLPLLTAAEGLPERALGPYNAILLAWGATAIAALIRETHRGERLAAVGGLAAFWPARALARHHYRWLAISPEPYAPGRDTSSRREGILMTIIARIAGRIGLASSRASFHARRATGPWRMDR
jgi:hypothetical protein